MSQYQTDENRVAYKIVRPGQMTDENWKSQKATLGDNNSIPLEPVMKIEISKQAYATLSRWASVGRTIDAAIDSLLELGANHEQAQYTIGELLDLKYALDDCNRACKEKMHKLSR